MKFKFNYPEKKLWRIKEDYFYEVSEENRQFEYRLFGIKITFRLGENHYLILNSNDEFRIKMPAYTAYYIKPLQNHELIHYQKKLTRNWRQMEINFEFTEADRVEKNEKGHWVPKRATG